MQDPQWQAVTPSWSEERGRESEEGLVQVRTLIIHVCLFSSKVSHPPDTWQKEGGRLFSCSGKVETRSWGKQCVLIYLHLEHQLRDPGIKAVSLFMLWFITGDWVAVGQSNTVRESGPQGQSTTALAWLYLPRSASQNECESCLCSYEGIFSAKQKATVFITNEWTRWESQWKGWHLCLFIQQQQNGIIFSPQSLSRLSRCTIDFNRPVVSKRRGIYTNTHKSTHRHEHEWLFC